MSYVKVQPDFTGGNPIEILGKPEATGITVDRQVVTLGTNELELVIVELLTSILNEMRALRFQNAQGMNLNYESTETLVEPSA